MANTWFCIDGKIGVDLDNADIDTSPKHPVGTIVRGNNSSEWMYVYAASTIAAYDALMIDQSCNAVPLTTTNSASGKNIGFAQIAITSANYGWVAIQGKMLRVNGAANCAANVALYTTATAGVLDDAIVSGNIVDGVVAYTSISNATAIYINAINPHITIQNA